MAGRVFALIPAAGKSSRMGRPKLSLPLGGRTILEHVIAALKQADLCDILVVLGPHVAELRPLVESAGARALVLAHETPDMRSTIERGLDWLETNRFPTDDDAWLLAPADHPTLDAEVVRNSLAKRFEKPGYSIFVPVYAGQRGHPTLIGWRHRRGIRDLPPGQGLNVYLRAQAESTLEVPLQTPEILCDLDTPEDYEMLLTQWNSRTQAGNTIPS